jgi:hypothetical protein
MRPPGTLPPGARTALNNIRATDYLVVLFLLVDIFLAPESQQRLAKNTAS